MSHVPTRLVMILFALCLPIASLAVDKSGSITEDETWTLDWSPVNVTGVFKVMPDTRLTIEPGVTVRFAPQSGILVRGEIVARGTIEDSIRFTASQGNEPNSWGGIYFQGRTRSVKAYDDAGNYTDAGSILEYCVIELGGDPYVELGSTLQMSSAHPLIAHSTIRNSGGESGTIQVSDDAHPMIRNCLITNNKADRGGAVNSGIGAHPIMWHNVISDNTARDNGGAFYLSLADIELIGNAIYGNETGAHGGAMYGAVTSDLNMRDNAFIGNRSRAGSKTLFFTGSIVGTIENNLFDSTGVAIYLQQATNDINAANNWWAYPIGFDFRSVIRDKMRDRYEPYVIFEPPLYAPPKELLTNPTHIDSIILCRNDRFDDEIPYGVAQGAPLRIRLAASDVNPGYRDVIPVRITSAQDPEGIVVPLWETAENSGVYIGRSRVAAVSNQSEYLIGDNEGGEVNIFAEFAPEVKKTYATLSPKPSAEPFLIAGERDTLHVVSHQPKLTWGYFDVLERPQETYRLNLYKMPLPGELPPKNFAPPTKPVWTSELDENTQQRVYDGVTLEDGESYLIQLSVWSGEFWSDVEQLPFRMNSLPTAPTPNYPSDDQIIDTRSPMLQSAISADRENDTLRYYYELFLEGSDSAEPAYKSDIFLTNSNDVTWTPPEELIENRSYSYHVRAFDPFEEGPWCSDQLFHVNSLEEGPAPYELLEPANGDTIFELHPLVKWQQSSDPDPKSSITYLLELSHSDQFSEVIAYEMDAEFELVLPDSLQNESQYYWRVTATDNSGLQQLATETFSFYVNTTPTVPLATYPLTGEELKIDEELQWDESPDPNPEDFVRYELELFEIIADGSFDTNRVVASKSDWVANVIKLHGLNDSQNLKDNTEYIWRVRAYDNHAAYSSFSQNGRFFCNLKNDQPNQVIAISTPPDTVIGTNDIELNWSAVEDPDLSDPSSSLVYEIECVVGDFNNGDVGKYETSAGEISSTITLTDNRLWHYRIRARDDEMAVGEWSEVKTVLVNVEEDAPAPFALKEPVTGASIPELDSLMFVWELSSDPDWESSIEYKLEIFPTDGKGQPFTITVTEGQYHYKSGLVNEAAYRWQVTAIDNIGLETVCNAGFEFSTNTTPTTPQVAELPEEILVGEELLFIEATDPNPADKLTYRLELAPTEQFVNVVVVKSDYIHSGEKMSQIIADLPNQDRLEDDKDYWFRLRATDNHGYTGGISDPVKFRFNRANDNPTVPVAPYAPTDSVVITTVTPEFSWLASDDEDLSDPVESLVYDLRFDTDGEFANSVAHSFTTSAGQVAYTVPEPLADNDVWSWQVRSRDDEGAVSPWSPTQAILINVKEDAPSVPTPLYPEIGSTLNILGPIVFKCEASTDIDWASSVTYKFEYGTASDLSGAKSFSNLAEPTYTAEGPLKNTTYYWRVTTTDNTGLKTASDIVAVTLDTRPSLPELTTPTGGVELLPMGNLTWAASTDPNPQDQVVYDIQVSTDALFGKLNLSSDNLNRTQAAIASFTGASKLNDNTIYHWRVKARDNHGIESAWSEPTSFFYNSINNPPSAVGVNYEPFEGDQVSTVALSWDASSDPDISDTPDKLTYKVELSMDKQFAGEFITLNSQPGATTVQPQGLTDDSYWYWRVRAVDDDRLEGPVSAIHSFIYNIRNDPPTAVTAPLTPANGAEVTTPHVSWGPADDQDIFDEQKSLFYLVEFCKDVQFSSGVLEATTNPNINKATHQGLTDNTIWYWRVRAVDDDGTEGAVSATMSFHYNSKNDPPDRIDTGFSPINDKEVTAVTLSWKAGTDPDLNDNAGNLSYVVELSQNSNFTGQTVTRIVSAGQNSIKIADLTDNSGWYWRVKAVDDEGLESGWSNINSFVYNSQNDPPTAFELTAPGNGSTDLDVNVSFSWNPSSDIDPGGEVSYKIIIAQDAGFSVGSQEFTTGSRTTFTPPGGTIQPGAAYYWKVVAEDGKGGSTYGSGSNSNPWSFTTKAPPPPPEPVPAPQTEPGTGG